MENLSPRLRQVETLRSTSLVEQIADQLVLGIASGRIPRGERVIESELAGDFGISRIPLREAMSMLESQGVLVAEPRRGRRVANFDSAQVREICEARLALEKIAVQQARLALLENPEKIEALDACLLRLERAALEPLDASATNQCDIDFHTEIYNISGNHFLQMIWIAIAKHVMIAFAVDQIFARLSPMENLKQHQHLRDLMMHGSVEDLNVEIEAHIMSYGKGITELATKIPALVPIKQASANLGKVKK